MVLKPGSSKSEKDNATAYGRWQGARWRRLCRGTAALFLGGLTIYGWARSSPSLVQGLTGLGVVGLVFISCEYVFARRMGLEICPDCLILRGPLRKVRVPWSHVQGILWREKPSLSRAKYLYLKTDQDKPRRVPRDAPLRIPTVAWVFDSSLPNDRILGPFLTSPNVRADDGREADAIALLERARTNRAAAIS
jgi:hypothetical protein